MNELPNLVVENILKFLDLKDLSRCRLLSKRFNLLIKDYIRIHNLLIIWSKSWKLLY